MEYIGAIAALIVLLFFGLSVRHYKAPPLPPETPLIGVRKHGRAWVKYSGCIRDADLEGWEYGALESREIINVMTGRPIGRRIVKK